jgi:hypothetical protein
MKPFKQLSTNIHSPLGRGESTCPCGNRASFRFAGTPCCRRCFEIEKRMLNDRATCGLRTTINDTCYIIPKHYAKKGTMSYEAK